MTGANARVSYIEFNGAAEQAAGKLISLPQKRTSAAEAGLISITLTGTSKTRALPDLHQAEIFSAAREATPLHIYYADL